MLDTIIKLAASELNMNMGEVREAREALHAELVRDDARYAAQTQMRHAAGSTTPLNSSADRAQQAYDKLRERVAKELPKMVSLMMAQQVAEQYRDETAAARDRHTEDTYERLSTKIHPETRDLFARLYEHGVTPWHLKALSNEDVAIIADLVRWKANDARYRDPDTPWRKVLAIFAGRLILKAGKGTKVVRSTPGTPVQPKRYSDPRYYMFNEMVDPAWGVTVMPVATPVVPSIAAPVVVVPGPHVLAVASAPAAAIETSTVDDDQMPTVEVEEPTIFSVAQARIAAEKLYELEPFRLGIYWPRTGVSRNDYTPERLIPALEQWVASPDTWSGAEEFLAAARAGRAREFIAERRLAGIERLTTDLVAGDKIEVRAAQRFGLI